MSGLGIPIISKKSDNNKQTNNILRAGLPIGWQLKNYLFTAEEDYLIHSRAFFCNLKAFNKLSITSE